MSGIVRWKKKDVIKFIKTCGYKELSQSSDDFKRIMVGAALWFKDFGGIDFYFLEGVVDDYVWGV
jgi:hypothetical protein